MDAGSRRGNELGQTIGDAGRLLPVGILLMGDDEDLLEQHPPQLLELGGTG